MQYAHSVSIIMGQSSSRKELDGCKSEKTKATGDLSACQSSRVTLEGQLRDCNGARATAQTGLNDCRSAHSTLEDQLRACNGARSANQIDLDECLTRRDALQGSMLSLQQRMDVAIAECEGRHTSLQGWLEPLYDPFVIARSVVLQGMLPDAPLPLVDAVMTSEGLRFWMLPGENSTGMRLGTDQTSTALIQLQALRRPMSVTTGGPRDRWKHPSFVGLKTCLGTSGVRCRWWSFTGSCYPIAPRSTWWIRHR